MRVLIVEDEIRLAESLQQILKENRINVDMVHDGLDGLNFALTGDYDVIILDIMLPSLDGLQIVSQLRAKRIDTPVIFLTAKDTLEDKIAGLNKGADDYLTKPFITEELIARVKALARRKGEIILEELVYEDLVLNLDNHQLSRKDKVVHLGLKEYDLVNLFMSYPNQVFSKEQLISRVWGYDSNVEDNNVEAYISFLRKKFSYLNSKVTVKTVRKVGYHLGLSDD